MSNQQEGAPQNDEDAELVSEFPPPPNYYTKASSLTPPPIPKEALIRSTKKAVTQRRAQEIEEKSIFGGNAGNGILGGAVPDFDEQMNDVSEDGPTIAVFGEGCYVEDPDLVPVDHDCNDPQEVKLEVSKLNKDILKGFIALVGDLVNKPTNHEQCRDLLLKNIELMLKECNKFREHQAREILIHTLETQLQDRQTALDELNHQIEQSDCALFELKAFQVE